MKSSPEVTEVTEECAFLNGRPRHDPDRHEIEAKPFGESFALRFCDCILISTVVQVNVVGFWRGLFGLFSFFHEFSHLGLIYLFAGMIQFQFTLCHKTYKKYLKEKKRSQAILRKVYAYMNASVEVLRWAGLWAILEELSGLDVRPPVLYSIICYVILVIFKFSNTLLAPPCTVTPDPPAEELFEFETPFRTSITKKMKASTVKRVMAQEDRLLDTLLLSLIVAPTVIGYWRGTWYLCDKYIFPKNLCANLVVSAVVGTLVQIGFAFVQDLLQENIRPENQRIFYYLISRLYTYVYGLACINMWRGEWQALDFFCGRDVVQTLVPTTVSFIVVSYIKTVRNLSSVPFIVATDSPKYFFQVPTMFKLTKSSNLPLYILDCFFSIFVIGSLVVFIWRGVWCLIDVFLFPENEKYSALSSLAIGYIIVIIIFGVQNSVARICEKLTGFWRLLVADLYVFVSFIGTINLWRGMWNLLNLYFLPEFPIWSYWISHLGCFACLVLMKCSNTILVRGVYLDGEDGGKCMGFPTFYFTLFFQKLKMKKEMEGTQEGKSCSENEPKETEKATNGPSDSPSPLTHSV